jgi:uncharacterized protein YkwD
MPDVVIARTEATKQVDAGYEMTDVRARFRQVLRYTSIPPVLYMKKLLLVTLLATSFIAKGQLIDSLNTARNCSYMKAEEKEMIYEINRLRSNPRSYLQYIEPMLSRARNILKNYGKGSKNYSLTYTMRTVGGKESNTIDTTWHYTNEEEVKALSTLVNDLKKLKKLSVLQPDSGISNAAQKHARDQDAHEWKLMHTGSDGSSPWDRILKYSPSMSFGNENIAGRGGMSATPRDFVIQLLVDSGIPGYGHRYNILDPQWTHAACVMEDFNGMNWCIQNFGQKR